VSEFQNSSPSDEAKNIVSQPALVLHILSIRDTYEPRAVWSLTGLAIRIAEGMGMHLDGIL